MTSTVLSRSISLLLTNLPTRSQPIFLKIPLERFPQISYWHGARPAAFDIANSIEKKAAANAGQLVAIANFYISIEDGAEALRVAQAAAAADPNSEPAYRTIGIAERVNSTSKNPARHLRKRPSLTRIRLPQNGGLRKQNVHLVNRTRPSLFTASFSTKTTAIFPPALA